MAYLDRGEMGKWRTVTLNATSAGMTAGEKLDRFKIEAMTEVALRLAGVLMIMTSLLMWFLLPLDVATGRILSHGALASFLAAGGLVVFAYGTRGFRRQFDLDLEKGTLSLTKININEQSRVARLINLGEIESVFLRRPVGRDGLATLLVRVRGASSPAIALSGAIDEVEHVHRELCEVIQLATGQTEKPTLRLEKRPVPRARLFARN